MREAVDDGSRVQAEKEHRTVAEGAEQGERERGVVRELQHEPGGRHRLHPGANDRHGLADVIAPEFGGLESGDLQNGATARFYGRRDWNATILLRPRDGSGSDAGQGLMPLFDLLG